MSENPFKTESASGNARPQRQANPRQHILVAENDPSLRRICTGVLIDSGYHVDIAEDGAAVWTALQLNSYDLLITENDMPKLSGVELLKQIYAAHMALPIIMVTGSLPQEEFIRSPWLHPAATLLKPYTLPEYLGTVKAVLHAAATACEDIALPPDWHNQPSTDVAGHDDHRR